MTRDRAVPVDPRLHWLLVANASRARLFERDADNGALRELEGFVHPESRMKGSELRHDRAGSAPKGVSRSTFEPPTSPAEREEEHFAAELAGRLEAAARDNRMPGWALIASSPFLGRLRAALGSAAAARLTQHVDRDLTMLAGRELEERVRELVPPRAE
ncbi:MAG: host attachment protein [Rubrivivax sp.]|nr:host attachment protein [Rubrivivax sp.]